MINQIRMIIAESLLGLAISIVPRNADGLKLAIHVKRYMESAIKERES